MSNNKNEFSSPSNFTFDDRPSARLLMYIKNNSGPGIRAYFRKIKCSGSDPSLTGALFEKKTS